MKLIHLTDVHLVEPGGTLYGLDPRARLDACIDDINRNHADADLCVITGDLTHWGEAAAYANLAEALGRLKLPLQMILGNHDNREVFRVQFPHSFADSNGFIQGTLDVAAGRLFFLDTNQPGTHAGWYCEHRQAWLRAELDAVPEERPLFFFMHHPPFNVGLSGLDSISLLQADAFAEIVRPYARRIRHLFFGHVHRPINGSWLGIPMSTLRGTNHQVWLDFKAGEDVIGSHEPPAYAVVLIDDSSVVIHTHDYMDASPKFDLGAQTVDEREESELVVS